MASPLTAVPGSTLAEDEAHATPLEVLEVWVGYAKDRYNALDARRVERRSLPRLLAPSVPVLLVVCLTLLYHVATARGILRGAATPLFVVLLALLMPALFLLWAKLIKLGFTVDKPPEPDSPSNLARLLPNASKAEMLWTIGTSYAAAAEALGKDNEVFARQARMPVLVLAWSLVALFATSYAALLYLELPGKP